MRKQKFSLLTNDVLRDTLYRPHMLEATSDKPPYAKLPNKTISEDEGFRLQSKDGKDLGALVFKAFHRMKTDKGKAALRAADGHMMTTEELLEREATNVQRYGLANHQRLGVDDIMYELRNPKNQTYGHFVAFVKDDKLKNGWRAAGFAAGEMRRFSSTGRGAVNMYYIPTTPNTKDFAETYVVKGDYRRPLKDFIFEESMKHIGANTGQDSLLAIYDAPPQEYNKKLKSQGFKALKPLIGVPSLQAESGKELDTIADRVHIVVKTPSQGESVEVYRYGIPLNEALESLRTYVGEGYKWSERLYINAARSFYKSAVMTRTGPVVPFLDTNIQELRGKARPAQKLPYLAPPKK